MSHTAEWYLRDCVLKTYKMPLEIDGEIVWECDCDLPLHVHIINTEFEERHYITGVTIIIGEDEGYTYEKMYD